jgi:hypothetical protein
MINNLRPSKHNFLPRKFPQKEIKCINLIKVIVSYLEPIFSIMKINRLVSVISLIVTILYTNCKQNGENNIFELPF